jgi:hypothetical protein
MQRKARWRIVPILLMVAGKDLMDYSPASHLGIIHHCVGILAKAIAMT